MKLLSHVYRQKFRTLLQKAFARGELNFFGELAPRAEQPAFEKFLAAATRRPWVVYAKPPFGGPEQVLKYLARYTHRVAISNRRLLAYPKGQVTFRYKDYAHGSRQRTMTLAAGEFLRRFLLHVLPAGFMRIRHYGYLANRHRQEKLQTCRRLLGSTAAAALEPPIPEPAGEKTEPSEQPITATFPCPVCKTGHLEIIETLARPPRRRFLPTATRSPAVPIVGEDSS